MADAGKGAILVIIILIILALLFYSGQGSSGQGALSLKPSFSFSPSLSPPSGGSGGGLGWLTWILGAGALGGGAYYWRRNKLSLTSTPENPTSGQPLTVEALLIKRGKPTEEEVEVELIEPAGAKFKDPAPGPAWPDKRKVKSKTDKDGKFSVDIDTTNVSEDTIKLVATHGTWKTKAEIFVAASQGTGPGGAGTGGAPTGGGAGTSGTTTGQNELRVLIVNPKTRVKFDVLTRVIYGSGAEREKYYYKAYRNLTPTERKKFGYSPDELKDYFSKLAGWLNEDIGVPVELVTPTKREFKPSSYAVVVLPSLDAIAADLHFFATLGAKWSPKGNVPGYGATIFTAPAFRSISKLSPDKSGVVPNFPFIPAQPFVAKKVIAHNPNDFDDCISCNLKPDKKKIKWGASSVERIEGKAINPKADPKNEHKRNYTAPLYLKEYAEGYIDKAKFPRMTYLNFDVWHIENQKDERYKILLKTAKEAVNAMKKQLEAYEKQKAKQ